MLDQQRLGLMHRYWCAANYLTVGQIYLQENRTAGGVLEEPDVSESSARWSGAAHSPS